MAKKKDIAEDSTSSAVVMPLDGKVPPQDIDAEKAILGALMLEKDAYSVVSEQLDPSCFYVPRHEMIFRTLEELAREEQPMDLVKVMDRLRMKKQLEEVGGAAYLASLTENIYSTANLMAYVDILYRKSLSRKLIRFSSEVMMQAYDDVTEAEVQMQNAESKLFEISQSNRSTDFKQINELIRPTLKTIEEISKQEGGMSGLPSGYPDIDKMTSGWQNSDLIIIAARPAMGKTAFVVSMAKNMAMDHGVPVALFNLEMSAEQLTKRLLSNVCEIDSNKIKNGELNDEEWSRLNQRISLLEDAPLFIDDTPSLSIFELRTKARRLVRQHGVKLIIIDYLQLMNASGMRFGSREQEVSMISRSLKVLAKELEIPIIALSQLNRGVEQRDANSKRPQLSDLRESGAIEQDADIVCFIHRPEYYKITEDPMTGESLLGIGEFIIAKHRNGPIGDARLRFTGAYTLFSPLNAAPRDTSVIHSFSETSSVPFASLPDNTQDVPF